jgi:hypothetical protein
MSLHTRLSRRFALSMLGSLLLMSVAATGALAQSTAPGADPSAPVTVTAPEPTNAAIPAVPNPKIVDAQPTAWERIEVASDGRTLTVYFWNGAEACNGLKDVEVSVVNGVTTVTVLTGLTPEAMFTTCIEGLFLYQTQVVLDAPILAGGA